MKLSALVASGALVLIPASARADGVDGGGDRPMQLTTGFGIMSVHAPDLAVTRTRFTLSPEFTFSKRLTIAPTVRLHSMNLDLREKNGMPFDLSITLPWQPTFGARVDYDLVDASRFRLTLRGEFESPLSANEARIGSYTPKRELSTTPIDIDTLRNHVVATHLWRSASASVVASTRLGRFRPYLEVGYIVIDSALTVNFDSSAGTLLANANVHPDRFYSDGAAAPFYLAGTYLDIGKGFSLRLGGSYAAVAENKLLVGEAALVVPIDIPHF